MKKLFFLSILLCIVLSIDAQTAKSSTSSKAKATTQTASKSDSKSSAYTGTGAEIKFEKNYVDFGTVKVGDVKVVTITYKNIGKKPLILDDVISSCDCTEVEWSKKPVMPGQTGTIKATYTAKNVGLISKRLTVLSNANTDRVVLQLKGEVK